MNSYTYCSYSNILNNFYCYYKHRYCPHHPIVITYYYYYIKRYNCNICLQIMKIIMTIMVMIMILMLVFLLLILYLLFLLFLLSNIIDIQYHTIQLQLIIVVEFSLPLTIRIPKRSCEELNEKELR